MFRCLALNLVVAKAVEASRRVSPRKQRFKHVVPSLCVLDTCVDGVFWIAWLWAFRFSVDCPFHLGFYCYVWALYQLGFGLLIKSDGKKKYIYIYM